MTEMAGYMDLPPRNPEESTKDYLLRLQAAGFLFHGSKSDEQITALEPRPTVDPTRDWNTDTAVFAATCA